MTDCISAASRVASTRRARERKRRPVARADEPSVATWLRLTAVRSEADPLSVSPSLTHSRTASKAPGSTDGGKDSFPADHCHAQSDVSGNRLPIATSTVDPGTQRTSQTSTFALNAHCGDKPPECTCNHATTQLLAAAKRLCFHVLL